MNLLNNPLVHECLKTQIALWVKEFPPASLDRIGAFVDVQDAEIDFALNAPVEELVHSAVFSEPTLAGAVARARCAE